MVILIADDDRLSRFALKNMLLELLDEVCSIYEVANGKRLVEQCRFYQPDIAFVDISMPAMDGLSAITLCQQCSADTQFVIVSGHQDFGYAQKSIALQTSGYLLKPVDIQQLECVLNRLRRSMNSKRQNQSLNFHVAASSCFRLWEEIGYYQQVDPCSDLPGEYFDFRFYLDAPPLLDEYRRTYRTLTESLQTLSRQLTSQKIPNMIWEPRDAGLDLIVRCEKSTTNALRHKLELTCTRVVANERVCITSLYVHGADLWSLFKSMKELASIEEYRFGIPKGSVFALEQLCFTPSEQALLSATKKLIAACYSANEQQYLSAMETISQTPADAIQTINMSQFTWLLGLCIGCQLPWSGSFISLAKNLKQCRIQIFAGSAHDESDKFSEILKYVDRHYMEELSVGQLADKMQITPNYFSKIFRDNTGKTFTQYLTEIRIVHAKRILLSQKEARVADVAQKVGYLSSRHFTNVFKKVVGCYPSDYRRQNQVEKK